MAVLHVQVASEGCRPEHYRIDGLVKWSIEIGEVAMRYLQLSGMPMAGEF